jgi:hypothetical protein
LERRAVGDPDESRNQDLTNPVAVLHTERSTWQIRIVKKSNVSLTKPFLFRRQRLVDRALRGFNARSMVVRLAGLGLADEGRGPTISTWYRAPGPPYILCHDIPSVTPPPYLPFRRRA